MTPLLRSRAEELIRRLKSCARQNGSKTSSPNAWGVPLALLRTVCKGLPRPDAELAAALWQNGAYEARQAAALLADASSMTQAALESWALQADCPELCDFCAAHVFSKSKHPLKLAEKWLKKENVRLRRAGLATLCAAVCARGSAPAEAELLKFFPILKNHAADPRKEIYESVNKTLRALGRKSPRLQAAALTCADDILDLFPQNKTACWTAKNVRWTLRSKTAAR